MIVGGGIAGLSAAHRLAGSGDGPEVLLLEASPVLGGKLRGASVAGVTLDVGAEAMLNRRPEGVALVREAGLGIVHPAVVASRIWTRGALRPLPRSLMGVPLDLDELAASGVLSDQGLRRVAAERDLAPSVLDGDISIGDLVSGRLGAEVVDRLVEPLLGGVYAGHARAISARAALPQLVALAERGSFLDQAAAVPTTYDAPVFAGVPGGMWRLPEALAASGRFDVRTGAVVRELRRTGETFELVVGPTVAPHVVAATAVVLATPAAATARLLAGVAPRASAAVARIEAASVAVVTLAYRADHVSGLEMMSGFLVPPLEGRSIKAATFSFAKWDWVREAGRGAGPDGEDLAFLRTSLGRHREEATLQAPDAQLVAVSRAELAAAVGLVAEPVAAHVQRWGGGLPQYAVGHLDLVAQVREAVAAVPGLAVCGAAYDGVGIPAVVGSAHAAAAQVARAE